MATQEQNFPWLEPVEDEDDAPRLSAGKMLAGIVLVLLALALVAGTMYWLGRRNVGEGSGPPELIAAPAGPYKIKPENPGGLDISGESGTAYATSAGEQPDAQLDLNAVPEEPVARPQPQQQAAATDDAPPTTDSAQAAPAGPVGGTIQLGYFPSQAAANSAWDSLSGRFAAVAGAGKVVVPYQSGYRLRAGFGSAAEASRACQLLKVAGEACFVVR